MAFEPRSMFASPGAFGVATQDVQPADGVDAEDHRYRSALIQHRIAREVRGGLRILGKGLPAFLEDLETVPGLSLDRQRRVLRGETNATFADLTFWASHFPLVSRFVAQYLERSFFPKSEGRAPAPEPTRSPPPMR